MADLALGAAIILAPVAGGSAHPTMLPVLSALVLVAFGACLVRAHQDHRLGVPHLALGLLAAGGLTLLQVVPLPHGLLSLLSPRAAGLRDFVEDGLALRPLSYEPGSTAREAAKLLVLALVVIVAHKRARSLGRPDKLVAVVVIAGLASGLVALVHRALGVDRMLGVLDAARSPASLFTTFVNPNHAAGFMVMTALSAAGLALAAKRREHMLGWFAAAAVLAVLSVLGFSRGGLVAMLIGVSLLAWRAGRGAGRRGTLVTVASGVALATVGAVLWRLDGVLRELAGAPADPLGLAAKLGAMKDAWPMIGDHWLLGIGRGAYGSVYPAYKTYPYQYTFTHPENFVVQALSDWGVVVGVAVVVALGLSIGRRLWRTESLVAVGALAGVVAVLVQNLADFSLELLGVSLPCAALLGATGAGVLSTVGVHLPRRSRTALVGALATAPLLVALALGARLGDVDEDLATLSAAVRASSRPELEALLPIHARHPAHAVVAAQLSFFVETSSAARSPRTAPRALAQALRWSNRALYLSPTYADAHLGAGRILVRLDHRHQGFGQLRQAWTLVAASPRVMDVIAEIIRLARTPAELVRALPRSDAAQDLVDGAEIPRLLRRLLQLDQAPLGRAVLAELRDTLTTVPPVHLLSIADEARRLGALDVAEGLLLRRAEAMPGDARTQLLLVDVAEAAGHADQAHDRLEAALAAASSEALPALHRRALELALARRDVDRARTALAGLRQTMPPTDLQQLMADQLEARVEQRAGNAPAALAALDRAVQRAPSNVGLRLERARLVASMGRPRQARLDVDAALRLDPKNAEALRLVTELDRPPSP